MVVIYHHSYKLEQLHCMFNNLLLTPQKRSETSHFENGQSETCESETCESEMSVYCMTN